MKYFALCVLFVLSLTSCRKQEAQIPYNKIVPDNSKSETLLAINENLTQREDSVLALFATHAEKGFIKNELGFWYRIDRKGQGKSIKKDDACLINYSLNVLKLNSKGESSLSKGEEGLKKITIGKKEIITAVDECLRNLHYGDSITIIVPWYLGYGMKGNAVVPPYSSLMGSIAIRN